MLRVGQSGAGEAAIGQKRPAAQGAAQGQGGEGQGDDEEGGEGAPQGHGGGRESPPEPAEVKEKERETLEVQPPGDRAVVFYQFTSLLDLVGKAIDQRSRELELEGAALKGGLLRLGLRFAKLTGSMPPKDRAGAVARLRGGASGGPQGGLKAGGVGLNQTRANHCYLMGPWWNSAAEERPARVHRIGQIKPFTVTKFVVCHSIEERIMMVL